MTEQNSNLQIRLVAGNAQQTTVDLCVGQGMEPFSVGTAGAWQIAANGVAELHAFFCFDGAGLYVSCANPGYSVIVNNAMVGSDWTPVPPGSRISLGSAQLVFEERRTKAEDRRHAASGVNAPKAHGQQSTPSLQSDGLDTRESSLGGNPAIPRPKGAPKPKIMQSARDKMELSGETTRFAPIDISMAPSVVGNGSSMIAGEGTPPHALSALPQSWDGSFNMAPGVEMDDATTMQGVMPAMMQGMLQGMMPGAMQGPMPGMFPQHGAAASGAMYPYGTGMDAVAPDVSPKSKWFQPFVDHWKKASKLQKAIVVLVPFAMFITLYSIATTEDRPSRRSAAGPTASATVSVGGKPGVVATASLAQVASTEVPAPAAPTTTTTPPEEQPATVADAAIPPPVSQPSQLKKGEKTLQRQAADVLAGGQESVALSMYRDLLKSEPGNTAYRDIVEILQVRVKKQ